jgi:hypothetical protein
MTFEEVPNTAATTLTGAYVNSINDAGPVTVFGVIDLTNGSTCNVTGLGSLPAAPSGAESSERSSAISGSSSDTLRGTRNTTDGKPAVTGSASDRGQLDLGSLVASALDRWPASGMTGELLATLRRLLFEVADLPRGYLGDSGAERIGWTATPAVTAGSSVLELTPPDRLIPRPAVERADAEALRAST